MTYRLGKLPAKANMRSLQFVDFVNVAAAAPNLPVATNFWKRRAPFHLGTWGNNQYGDCTRASQAVAAMRNERLESRTTIDILDVEVVRVYMDMSNRLYGGGDNGAYEEDALSEWRKPDLTFRDTRGRPHTIDAFTRLDPKNPTQLKTALWLAGGAHGIKMCLNLPNAWSATAGVGTWDVSRRDGRVNLLDEWAPGSWGDHSMYADDYDERGIYVEHTWGLPRQLVTWEAVMAYADEAHSFIDSVDTWRKRPQVQEFVAMDELVDAVNQVSSQKL